MLAHTDPLCNLVWLLFLTSLTPVRRDQQMPIRMSLQPLDRPTSNPTNDFSDRDKAGGIIVWSKTSPSTWNQGRRPEFGVIGVISSLSQANNMRRRPDWTAQQIGTVCVRTRPAYDAVREWRRAYITQNHPRCQWRQPIPSQAEDPVLAHPSLPTQWATVDGWLCDRLIS